MEKKEKIILFRSSLDTTLVNDIFQRFQENNPQPKTELMYSSPFQLLVAVMLSAQMTDKGVNRATASLFQHVATPQQLLDLGEASLLDHLSRINYYRTKVRHLLATAQRLVQDFDGDVPQSREALETLPGVGRKTANVVLNALWGWPTIPVDTHLFRVARRLGLSAGKTPLKVEKDLEECVPELFKIHAHHWLVLHGRYVCKARKPLCSTCLLADICPSAGGDVL